MHRLTASSAIAASILIGAACGAPTDSTGTDRDRAAAEWQQERERRQAALERTREAGQRAAAAAANAPPRARAEPPEPASDWQMINFVNEFGERTGQGAVSLQVGPVRPMSFPYGDTTARIFVNCDRAWVRFSEAPNLTGGTTRDGYDVHTITVRVDGNDARWRIEQSWGDNDLRFLDSGRAVAALTGGETFALAIPWYGEGSVAFSWSLVGSSDAIKRSCD